MAYRLSFRYHYGSFERRVMIPENVKPEDIVATYKDGILEVVVPRVAAMPEARKSPVQVGEERKALTARSRKK